MPNIDIFKKEYPEHKIIGIRWEATEDPTKVCYVIEGLKNNNIVTLKFLVDIDDNGLEHFIKNLGSESRDLYEMEKNKEGESFQKEVNVNNYLSYKEIFLIIEEQNELNGYYVHNWDLIQYDELAMFRVFLKMDSGNSKTIKINAINGEILP